MTKTENSCVICNKPSGKRKTCSRKCLGKLQSKASTERARAGIGWKGIYLGKRK